MRASGSSACTRTKALGEANGRFSARLSWRASTGESANSISSAWKRSFRPTYCENNSSVTSSRASSASIAATQLRNSPSADWVRPRSAARRAQSPSSVPRISIASQISRSEKAFTAKPPEGISSSRPSSSSRTSAMRIGVRETPRRSTTTSSEMRSPALSSPVRIRSRRLSNALTVCDDCPSNWVTRSLPEPCLVVGYSLYTGDLGASTRCQARILIFAWGCFAIFFRRPSGCRLTAPSRRDPLALRHAEIFLQHRRIGRERGARGLMHDVAALDDGGAVGDAEDLLGVLLHQDRREALVADDALERGEQFVDDDRREAFERLVQQDD